MKLNINKLCFLILYAICIGLTIVLAGLLLITNYILLQYITVTFIYIEAIFIVKVVHKYPLYRKK
jgi:hypothetical protein